MSLLYPTLLKNRIVDLSLKELEALGVKALLLDVDNTLTRHHSQELPEDVAAWLETMKAAGIGLMLVSNSKERRVAPFAKKIGLPFVHTSCKPVPFGFRRAAKALGVSPACCMAVGDQTFTDVLGAKLAGVRVTQLIPVEEESGWSFRMRRKLEKRVLSGYRKQLERRKTP